MIKFKHKKDETLFFQLHPMLQMVLIDSSLYWHDYGHDMFVTATVSTLLEDQDLGRVSSSHREKRAADIRIKDMPPSFVKDWTKWLKTKYGNIGAFSSDGKQNVIVLHGKGDNYHAHIQLNKNFAL